MLKNKSVSKFALMFFAFAYFIPFAFLIGGLLIEDTIHSIIAKVFTLKTIIFILLQIGGILFLSNYLDNYAKKYIIDKKQSFFIIGNIFVLLWWLIPLIISVFILEINKSSHFVPLIFSILTYNLILNLLIGALYGGNIKTTLINQNNK